MGGPHKRNPMAFRPGILPGDPEGDREWLLALAAKTGRPYGAIVSEALSEYRDRVESTQTTETETK